MCVCDYSQDEKNKTNGVLNKRGNECLARKKSFKHLDQ